MDTLSNLFEDTIKDLYNAEHNFLKGMQKLVKSSTDTDLKNGIEKHIGETKTQIERLDELAKSVGFKPTGEACKASQGLVAEAEEHIEKYDKGPVLDAAIILCLQKNEHYEITSYATLIAWAEKMGMKDSVKLLQQTLKEEEAADALLTKVAEGLVNEEALSVGGPGSPKGKASVH